MRKMQEQILANIAGIEDGLEQSGAGDHDVPDVLRRSSGVRRAADPGAGLVQGPQAADLFRAPRDQRRSGGGSSTPGLIAEGRMRDMPVERITDVVGNVHLRHHVHQLLHRPDQAGGGAGPGDPRHRLPRHPDRRRSAAGSRPARTRKRRSSWQSRHDIDRLRLGYSLMILRRSEHPWIDASCGDCSC